MLSFKSCKHTGRVDSAHRPRFSRRLISLSITSVLLTGWIVGGVLMVPMNNAEAKAGQGDKTSAENLKLQDEVVDLDLMHAIGPLKLTGEQIDKIVPLIEKAKSEYDQNINDLYTNTVGQIASDIHTAHKDALSGTPIPKEFDTKVKEKLDNFFERRDKVNASNIQHMSDAMEKVLTEDQKKFTIKFEKEIFKPGPKDEDIQFYRLYVTNIIIGNPRVLPLLKELKANGK